MIIISCLLTLNIHRRKITFFCAAFFTGSQELKFWSGERGCLFYHLSMQSKLRLSTLKQPTNFPFYIFLNA